MDSVGKAKNGQATVDSDDLLDAVLKVSQLVRIRLNDWLGQFDLNDGRLGVLSALSNAGDCGLSQAALAEILHQSASNVSTLIERMSRDGLVTRVPSATDRRKRLLSISSSGQSQLASVETKRTAWSRNTFHMITIQEQSELLTLLQKIGAGQARISANPQATTETNSEANRPSNTMSDPSTDPQSPHFALQQMLLALSSSGDMTVHDERAAA